MLALLATVVSLAFGLGMFKAIDVAGSGPRKAPTTVACMAILISGVILLVLGVLWMFAVVSILAVKVLSGAINVGDTSRVVVTIVADVMLSIVPIGGALLVAVGVLLRRGGTRADAVRLYERLDALSIVAWGWMVIATLAACTATSSPFPLFVLVLVCVVAGMRRSSDEAGLIWVMAIAAQKQLPLAPAVEEYAEQCRGRYRRRVLELADRLSEGHSLPIALEADSRLVAPPVRVAARVGWESGVLGQSLRELAAARSLRRPAWHALLGRLTLLILPLIVLQAVTGFVMYFIAPKFKRIFADFGVGLPTITQFVYDIGDETMTGVAVPTVIVFELVCLVYALGAFVSDGRWWVPFPLDRVLRPLDRAVILRALAVCVEAGRTLSAGLVSLAHCYPKLWVRARMEQVIERAEQGTSWVECLREQGFIRHTDAAVLESAQRAGNLVWALREMADRGERQLAYVLAICVQVLFPIVVIGVGAVVFLFAVAYFSPLAKLIMELSG